METENYQIINKLENGFFFFVSLWKPKQTHRNHSASISTVPMERDKTMHSMSFWTGGFVFKSTNFGLHWKQRTRTSKASGTHTHTVNWNEATKSKWCLVFLFYFSFWITKSWAKCGTQKKGFHHNQFRITHSGWNSEKINNTQLSFFSRSLITYKSPVSHGDFSFLISFASAALAFIRSIPSSSHPLFSIWCSSFNGWNQIEPREKVGNKNDIRRLDCCSISSHLIRVFFSLDVNVVATCICAQVHDTVFLFLCVRRARRATPRHATPSNVK